VSGDRETRRQILLYTLILVPLGAAPWLGGYAGLSYGVVAVATGAVMLALAWRVLRERPATGDRASRRLFAFSILYLFLLFAALPVDRWLSGFVSV
jgi:protoheme IX farnesyltransferase